MQGRIIFLLAVVLPVVLLMDTGCVSLAPQNKATVPEPCRIATARQLQEMKKDLSGHYVLVNDIDASETATWDNGKGFSPIGDSEHPFTGTFDGQGHAINGLKIDRFGQITRNIALFGFTGEKALIKNVFVRNASVKGCDYVGILVGMNQGAISHCHVSGKVSGSGSFGGLVGCNAKGRISHCSAAADVGTVWVGNHLGGLVGSNSGGIISDCFATGAVLGQENPGGLVGINNEGVILRCYASGSVKSSFGGVSDSYRRGVGGLVGANQGGGNINDCFATGNVTGSGRLPVGGLLGINIDKASVKNSYCLLIRGDQLPGVGKVYPDAGPVECEPVAEINAAFFQHRKGPLDSWDFKRTWSLDEKGSATTLPRFKSACDLSQTTGISRNEDGNFTSAARGEPPARGTVVMVEIRDGSRLEGKTGIENLAVATAYGKIKIPLPSVRTVEFMDDHETVKVAMSNGDLISGVLDLGRLSFNTAWGTLNIGVEHIARITVRR